MTLVVFATCFLLGGSGGPASATQYSPPWADALWAHWGGGGLNTQGTMSAARDSLLPGYDAVSTNPSSARAAMGSFYAQSDAIWWMAGHGNVGRITTISPQTVTTSVISVSSQTGESCAAPNACLTDYTWSQLHDTRLMVFQGCWSGSALPNGDRLPKRAVNVLGVDSSVSFANEIGFSALTSDIWARNFATYGYAGHYSVSDSAWMATNDVFFYSGAYHGYTALVVYGGVTEIYPAAYGS